MNERLEEIKRRIEGFNDEQNYFRDMKWLIETIERYEEALEKIRDLDHRHVFGDFYEEAESIANEALEGTTP